MIECRGVFEFWLSGSLDSQSLGCLQGDSSFRVRYTGEWAGWPREHSLATGSVKWWGKFYKHHLPTPILLSPSPIPCILPRSSTAIAMVPHCHCIVPSLLPGLPVVHSSPSLFPPSPTILTNGSFLRQRLRPFYSSPQNL